jgi:hypothetical protein
MGFVGPFPERWKYDEVLVVRLNGYWTDGMLLDLFLGENKKGSPLRFLQQLVAPRCLGGSYYF